MIWFVVTVSCIDNDLYVAILSTCEILKTMKRRYFALSSHARVSFESQILQRFSKSTKERMFFNLLTFQFQQKVGKSGKI
jgi:hypothetical protein